jgi:hypothetical protein
VGGCVYGENHVRPFAWIRMREIWSGVRIGHVQVCELIVTIWHPF